VLRGHPRNPTQRGAVVRSCVVFGHPNLPPNGSLQFPRTRPLAHGWHVLCTRWRARQRSQTSPKRCRAEASSGHCLKYIPRAKNGGKRSLGDVWRPLLARRKWLKSRFENWPVYNLTKQQHTQIAHPITPPPSHYPRPSRCRLQGIERFVSSSPKRPH
jgi:hypothetical protein